MQAVGKKVQVIVDAEIVKVDLRLPFIRNQPAAGAPPEDSSSAEQQSSSFWELSISKICVKNINTNIATRIQHDVSIDNVSFSLVKDRSAASPGDSALGLRTFLLRDYSIQAELVKSLDMSSARLKTHLKLPPLMLDISEQFFE